MSLDEATAAYVAGRIDRDQYVAIVDRIRAKRLTDDRIRRATAEPIPEGRVEKLLWRLRVWLAGRL